MKKSFLAVALLALASQARADWHGLSLPDYSQGIPTHPIATRGFINGQWLAGYGTDLFYYQIPGSLAGKPLPKLYAALDHQWNAAELVKHPGNVQGLLGPSIGASIGGLASKIQAAGNFVVKIITAEQGPDVNLPAWFVNDLDKWVTVETGGGYRVFGHMSDVKPLEAWVGGRVTVNFDVNAHH